MVQIASINDNEAMQALIDLASNGELIAVLRPDGLVGWMPAPHARETEPLPVPRLCPTCQGEGFLSDEMQRYITADFRLAGLCPDCHGLGELRGGE